MGNVLCVAEQQLQCMATWRQRNRRLGLTGAEVQMIFVVRNWLVQGGQRRIYQQMMMAGICLFDPSRREAHIDETESDRHRLRDVIPIGRRNDILSGAGRRSVSSRRGRTDGGGRRSFRRSLFELVPHRRPTRAHRRRQAAGPEPRRRRSHGCVATSQGASAEYGSCRPAEAVACAVQA